MTSQTKPLPGATVVAGVQYLPGQRNTLVPVENIRAQDILLHEVVYKLTDYALDLSAEIARFNGHSRADLAEFDALLAQEYGITRDPEFKGNRTYTSADGKRQVKIAMADRVSYGPGLQAAKALLDELIIDNVADAGPILKPLVNYAFRVDKEGNVDPNMLRAIKRLEIPDERWPQIVRAINEAELPLGTASYVRFYQQRDSGRMELIPLDIAAAHPTPEAFARRSLRRQVEELTAQLEELLSEEEAPDDVRFFVTMHLESALIWIDNARRETDLPELAVGPGLALQEEALARLAEARTAVEKLEAFAHENLRRVEHIPQATQKAEG